MRGMGGMSRLLSDWGRAFRDSGQPLMILRLDVGAYILCVSPPDGDQSNKEGEMIFFIRPACARNDGMR